MTISIGGWGIDDTDQRCIEERNWMFIEARPNDASYEMMVREPEESFYFGSSILGKPMSRSEALASTFLVEFFAVADFIAFNDPAVKSYLLGQEVNVSGRKGID